jgi:hypothetical protein
MPIERTASVVSSPCRSRFLHLISHLIKIARAAGLEEFVAEVLAENAPMLEVFERCSLARATRRERGIVHVTLALSRGAKK